MNTPHVYQSATRKASNVVQSTGSPRKRSQIAVSADKRQASAVHTMKPANHPTTVRR
jgi:hypothetical protein